MRISNIYVLMVLTTLFTGCSHLTKTMEQPVIEEKLNKSLFKAAEVGTLSLTPERRVVLVNFSNNRFCAEAPTEVGVDMSRLLKIAAEASKGGEYKAGLEAVSAAASSNSVLNKRTQGMQLFLANAYFICQMYMNNAINEIQLMDLQLRTLNAVAPLIEKEIAFVYQNKATGNDNKKFVPLDINKALDEFKMEESEPMEE